MRTSRLSRWRSVLFKRSIWAVCLVSLPPFDAWRQAIVRPPEIAVTDAALIGRRQLAPHPPTRQRAPVADEKREDLARPTTLNDPDATVLFFDLHAGKEFIHLQLIGGLAFSEGGFQRRQRLGFF